MKNELSLEKNILKNKNNDWAVLRLFFNYIKSNRSILIAIFLLPILFCIIFSGNLLSTKTEINGLWFLMIWLLEAATFSIQTFLAILLDFKQSIIYRRIGLTSISKFKFILIASIFNLLLLLFSDAFIFVITLIIAYSMNSKAFLLSIFNWQIFLVLFIILICAFLTLPHYSVGELLLW